MCFKDPIPNAKHKMQDKNDLWRKGILVKNRHRNCKIFKRITLHISYIDIFYFFSPQQLCFSLSSPAVKLGWCGQFTCPVLLLDYPML